MEVVIFLLSYIPFWAVPIMAISGEFAYLYWLKSHIKISFMFLSVALFSMLMIVYYYWAGSSENAGQLFYDFFQR